MTLSLNQLDSDILYPDSDGTPMAESDPARDYLIYCVESLSIYFQNQPEVYVSGNLFIYYQPQTRQYLLSHAETEQALEATEQALETTERALQEEAQTRRGAVPRLLRMGLNVEQVAEALGLSVDEIRQLVDWS